ncbi:MAG: glycine--tRNA ligase subunit beta [Alphaproteobacteria bacterium]|nr:glycine--tRNA ligase subunit beta [Alphaproteobacteria bacterium]
MPDLLLELFSEEVPARMQADAAEHLKTALTLESIKHKLLPDSGGVPKVFVTPRRLAVWITGLAATQSDTITERKGPKIDAPEAAIQGFLKSTGLTRQQLENRNGVYFAAIQQKGRPTADVLKEIIEKILADFPWPKSMRWGDGEARWVRPLHSILCRFGDEVVPVEFAGVTAGDVTVGHRFLAPQPIAVSASGYERALQEAKVIADREKRKAEIRRQAEAVAAREGLTLRPDEGLLEEVTGLVEWPVVLSGRIDPHYMDLPPEVLVSEMRGHQKYFALQRADGTLADQFLITANMETNDGGAAVVAGNERVLRARLSDGRFFWDQDRKKRLEEWGEGLKNVTFHARLGTVAEKVERVAALAQALAEYVPDADRKSVERAARLCKADLTTGMVGEFPELQGVMGRYYALHQGEDAAVADAIRDHYKPLGPSDAVPSAPVSVCVALADKLDTLVSMFAIGEKPTGSKDPFALRRAALGVIRIILENGIRLPLRQVVASRAEPQEDILPFFSDRLKVQLKDQGVRHDLIAAVFALGEDDLVRLVARVKALQAFLGTEDGANLLAAYKRAANIVAIEEKKDKQSYSQPVDSSRLILAEEHALHQALIHTLHTSDYSSGIEFLLEQERFTHAMSALSKLRPPIDAFFDTVLVNDKDAEVRANRLRLLAQFRAALDKIANFALIEG